MPVLTESDLRAQVEGMRGWEWPPGEVVDIEGRGRAWQRRAVGGR